jgi:hypothetical protein
VLVTISPLAVEVRTSAPGAADSGGYRGPHCATPWTTEAPPAFDDDVWEPDSGPAGNKFSGQIGWVQIDIVDDSTITSSKPRIGSR